MSTIIRKISRALRIGQLPRTLRSQLQSEGRLLFSHEGIPVTVVLKDFRAPGIFCGLRLMSFIGFLASSENRLVASASFVHRVCLNLTYDDPRFRRLVILPKGKRLFVSFNAEGLIPKASGDVTLRFHVGDPQTIARLLAAKGAKVGSAP